MKMKKIILAIFATTLMCSSMATAAEMKIGYVDIKVSMENTKAYMQGIKRVEALQNKKKKKLESMRQRVSELDKELQMQSMAMTSDHQAAKQQEFTSLKKEFDRELQDASDELKREKRQLDQVMFGKFYDVVRAYGKDRKFDVILPKSATIYGSATYDITADITKIMDSK
jgi:outer membrane protein